MLISLFSSILFLTSGATAAVLKERLDTNPWAPLGNLRIFSAKGCYDHKENNMGYWQLRVNNNGVCTKISGPSGHATIFSVLNLALDRSCTVKLYTGDNCDGDGADIAVGECSNNDKEWKYFKMDCAT